MNKKDLAAKVAKRTETTIAEASKCVDAVFLSIKEDIIEGNTTTIKGFGSFLASSRAARQGINPATKQPITIAARKVMKFRASKTVEIK